MDPQIRKERAIAWAQTLKEHSRIVFKNFADRKGAEPRRRPTVAPLEEPSTKSDTVQNNIAGVKPKEMDIVALTTPKKRKTDTTAPSSNRSTQSVSTKRSSKSQIMKKQQMKENKAAVMKNLTGGLKLLKREIVTMTWISTIVTKGKKLTLKYTHKGEPYGKQFSHMQSYIGVLARTKVHISYLYWRKVSPKQGQIQDFHIRGI